MTSFVTPVDGQPAVAEHVAQLTLNLNGTRTWPITIAGVTTHQNHVLFSADNTYDIGASGATRPRNLYVGTSARVGTGLYFDTWSMVASNQYRIGTNTADTMSLATNDVTRWTVDASGHLQAGVSNTYDIGTSTFRPRTVYAASSIIAPVFDGQTVGPAGAVDLSFRAQAGNRWQMNASGFIAISDNTLDIGASGATRPRSIYAGTSVVTPTVSSSGSNLEVKATNQIQFFSGATQRWTIDSVGISPYADNTYDIGWASFRPRDLYLGRDLIAGRHIMGAFDLTGTSVIKNSTTNSMTYLSILPNGTNSWATLQIIGGANATASSNKKLALNQYDTTSSIVANDGSTSLQINAAGSSSSLRFATANADRVTISSAGLTTFADIGYNTPSVWNNGFTQLNGRIKMGYGSSGADPIALIGFGASNAPTSLMTQTNQYMMLAEYWGNSLATGTIKGLEFGIKGSVSGTNDMVAMHIKPVTRQAPGVVQNATQLKIDPQVTSASEGGANNNIGLEIGNQSGATTNWSLLVRGPSKFDAGLTVGTGAGLNFEGTSYIIVSGGNFIYRAPAGGAHHFQDNTAAAATLFTGAITASATISGNYKAGYYVIAHGGYMNWGSMNIVNSNSASVYLPNGAGLAGYWTIVKNWAGAAIYVGTQGGQVIGMADGTTTTALTVGVGQAYTFMSDGGAGMMVIAKAT